MTSYLRAVVISVSFCDTDDVRFFGLEDVLGLDGWPYDHADWSLRLPTWDFLLAFCSSKTRRFWDRSMLQTDGQTGRRTDSNFA